MAYYNSNYAMFLAELIESAIVDGDLKFVTGEYGKAYARIARLDYKYIVRQTFISYCKKIGRE